MHRNAFFNAQFLENLGTTDLQHYLYESVNKLKKMLFLSRLKIKLKIENLSNNFLKHIVVTKFVTKKHLL